MRRCKVDHLELQTLNENIIESQSNALDVKLAPKFNGPLSGPMWSKVAALNSKMPDDFDWSVYDRLYEKFGDDQPRGGVIFKAFLRLANYHTSCTKCHYAFEI